MRFRTELTCGRRPGATTDGQPQSEELERQVRDLKEATELRKAALIFVESQPDPRHRLCVQPEDGRCHTGSTIRHSIGVWPVVINDETVVEHCLPGQDLVLLAKLAVRGGAHHAAPRRDVRWLPDRDGRSSGAGSDRCAAEAGSAGRGVAAQPGMHLATGFAGRTSGIR